jgi:hypothetical protein
LIHNNYLLLYNPKKEIRLYYKDHVFWSYMTYMQFLVKNKRNQTYYLLRDTINTLQLEIINNGNNGNNRNNGNKKANREKKNFKTKKYVKEWEN